MSLITANLIMALKKYRSKQAGRLALTSKDLMIEVGRLLLLEHNKHAHPICFLEQNLIPRQSWQWSCVLCAIAFGENIIPPMGNSLASMHCLPVFINLYQHSFRGKLAMAREVNPDCRFTFHIVTRWIVQGSKAAASFQEKASKTGGELAVHKFICVKQVIIYMLMYTFEV